MHRISLISEVLSNLNRLGLKIIIRRAPSTLRSLKIDHLNDQGIKSRLNVSTIISTIPDRYQKTYEISIFSKHLFILE